MLTDYLVARRRPRRLACGALYQPAGRLEVDTAYRHPQLGGHRLAYGGFDRQRVAKLPILRHFRNDNDVLGSEARVEHSESDRTAVVDGRVRRDDLFNVLRVDILSADDDQVLLAAH